jgi:TPR repeat protein
VGGFRVPLPGTYGEDERRNSIMNRVGPPRRIFGMWAVILMLFVLVRLNAAWAQAQIPPDPQLEAGLAALERRHYATALRAFRASADRGSAWGASNLGYMYEHGLGVGQSYSVALEWYRKAASQGLATAQHNLGTLYFNGWGVEKNVREAFSWFRRAAQQNLAPAQYMVGLSLLEGHGIGVQAQLALDWFLKAARQGHADAQMMVAKVFLAGEAAKPSPYKAYIWADIATAAGQPDASLVRDYASFQLTARELERAKVDASKCQASRLSNCPEP